MAPQHATVLVEASRAPIARGVLRLDADPEAPSAASMQSRRSARLALGVLVTIALVPVIGCVRQSYSSGTSVAARAIDQGMHGRDRQRKAGR